MTSVFYNDFLTQGRGLFLSILEVFGVLFVSFWPLMKWIKIALAIFLSGFWVVSLGIIQCFFCLSSPLLPAGLGFNGMVARESGESF